METAALGSLDPNRDGSIVSGEMGHLWLWTDLNSDARPQPGELVPAASKLKSISYRTRTENGSTWSPKGVERLDGTKVDSWDWWSQVPNYEASFQLVPFDPAEKYVIYRWQDSKGPTALNGYLRFFKRGSDLYVASTQFTKPGLDLLVSTYEGQGPCAKVSRQGSKLTWQFVSDLRTEVVTAELLPDGNIVAKTNLTYSDKKQKPPISQLVFQAAPVELGQRDSEWAPFLLLDTHSLTNFPSKDSPRFVLPAELPPGYANNFPGLQLGSLFDL